jgi:hypothetical protein
MTAQQIPGTKGKKSSIFKFSLDAWAVTLALVLSLLVWIGLLKHIPW